MRTYTRNQVFPLAKILEVFGLFQHNLRVHPRKLGPLMSLSGILPTKIYTQVFR